VLEAKKNFLIHLGLLNPPSRQKHNKIFCILPYAEPTQCYQRYQRPYLIHERTCLYFYGRWHKNAWEPQFKFLYISMFLWFASQSVNIIFSSPFLNTCV